ncbi:MAG: hypothetical protein U0841_26870 [Chloroflexia bacterium]
MTLHPWIPRTLIVALFATFATLFALPQVCFACSCVPPGPPLEELARASAVFRGKVTAIDQIGSVKRVTVQVTTVWKGAVTTETQIQTNDNSAACGFPFELGSEYLIYATATATDDASGRPVAPLSTYLCSRTQLASRATDDFAALGPGQAPTPGLPNTGGGVVTAGTERMIPGELLIGGAILAFLAVLQRSRSTGRVARGERLRP